MKNILKQFWQYEPFWKWWGRAIWTVWAVCWFLILWGGYLQTIK